MAANTLQPNWLPEPVSFVLEWIHQEQALLAGLIALAGAIWTVKTIRRQIAQQDEHLAFIRSGSASAYRARLAFALSALDDYISNCYNLFRVRFLMLRGETDELPPSKIPELPVSSFDVFAGLIEFTDNRKIRRHLEITISNAQVYHARMKCIGDPISRNEHVFSSTNAIIDRAVEYEFFRYQVGTLYNFARYESEETGEIPDGVTAAKTFRIGKGNDQFINHVAGAIAERWDLSREIFLQDAQMSSVGSDKLVANAASRAG